MSSRKRYLAEAVNPAAKISRQLRWWWRQRGEQGQQQGKLCQLSQSHLSFKVSLIKQSLMFTDAGFNNQLENEGALAEVNNATEQLQDSSDSEESCKL